MKSAFKILSFSLLVFLKFGCTTHVNNKPILLLNTDTLLVPFNEVEFKGSIKKGKAVLYTPTQPIELAIEGKSDGFIIKHNSNFGIIEGKGKILITSDNKYFIYNIYLKNKKAAQVTYTDYRSPKTVIIDSSLTHQKILVASDQWRNIRNVDKKEVFSEEIINLTNKTGTYRAQKDFPISSYYVQAGLCTSIPIKYAHEQNINLLTVTAGPLYDKYENLVAEGTLVKFIYGDNTFTYQMNASTIDGIAQVELPIEASEKYYIYAMVKNIKSEIITLNK